MSVREGKVGKWGPLVCIVMLLFLSACEVKSQTKLPTVEDYRLETSDLHIKKLRFGIVTGPYGDMFKQAILPILEKKGYQIDIVTYEKYNEPNAALANHEIDFNLFQNYYYLNNYKFTNDLALSAIVEIPTVAMAIYSKKIENIDDIPFGASVTLPSDAINLARALNLLAVAGVIELAKDVSEKTITIDDVVRNKKSLEFVLVGPEKVVGNLDTTDLCIVNGNFAITSGLSVSDAIFVETLDENYFNVIAVRTEDLSQDFVKDVADAVHSDAFRAVIENPNGAYTAFQRPPNF